MFKVNLGWWNSFENDEGEWEDEFYVHHWLGNYPTLVEAAESIVFDRSNRDGNEFGNFSIYEIYENGELLSRFTFSNCFSVEIILFMLNREV